jgi:predicted 3-demethylubiquinone-9 3-methyltransferase (glyoxalase superfamily)
VPREPVPLRPKKPPTFNEAVSIVVPCADQAEVDYYWSNLVEGGQENVCGWLTGG